MGKNTSLQSSVKLEVQNTVSNKDIFWMPKYLQLFLQSLQQVFSGYVSISFAHIETAIFKNSEVRLD